MNSEPQSNLTLTILYSLNNKKINREKAIKDIACFYGLDKKYIHNIRNTEKNQGIITYIPRSMVEAELFLEDLDGLIIEDSINF